MPQTFKQFEKHRKFYKLIDYYNVYCIFTTIWLYNIEEILNTFILLVKYISINKNYKYILCEF